MFTPLLLMWENPIYNDRGDFLNHGYLLGELLSFDKIEHGILMLAKQNWIWLPGKSLPIKPKEVYGG